MSLSINKRTLFNQAWTTARYRAERQGGTARSHFAASLTKCWENAKKLAPQINAMLGRVQVEADRIAAELRGAPRQNIYREHWQGSFTKTAEYVERMGLRA